MNMMKMRWPDVQKYLDSHPEDASVIIPISPVEEHGPHLPIVTDLLSAVAIAERVSAAYHCLVFPPIPLMFCGISNETTGTYRVEQETLRLMARDLLLQLSRKGFKKIMFFSGHGGHSTTVIMRAILEFLPETAKANILNFNEAVPEQAAIVGVSDKDIHAGGIETSRMLYLYPQLVGEIPEADYHQGEVVSKSGICGDPQKASRQKGELIVKKTVQAIIDWFES